MGYLVPEIAVVFVNRPLLSGELISIRKWSKRLELWLTRQVRVQIWTIFPPFNFHCLHVQTHLHDNTTMLHLCAWTKDPYWSEMLLWIHQRRWQRSVLPVHLFDLGNLFSLASKLVLATRKMGGVNIHNTFTKIASTVAISGRSKRILSVAVSIQITMLYCVR